MEFTHEMTYDASPAEVRAMLADPDFREQVCKAIGSLRHDVRVDGSGDALEVVVEQVQPAKGIPSFARKFVGDEIEVVQRESWRSPTAADLTVEIPGKPGALKGGIVLTGDENRTTESVTGELKVGIPLVGGRLEGLIAGLLGDAMRAEEKVGQAYLAR